VSLHRISCPIDRIEVIKNETIKKENIMLSRLMIALTTISLVGSSVATASLAAPYHGVGKARYLSGANISEEVIGAAFATVGEEEESSQGSAPRYHGGPKNPY
jgi:hypothetical protein